MLPLGNYEREELLEELDELIRDQEHLPQQIPSESSVEPGTRQNTLYDDFKNWVLTANSKGITIKEMTPPDWIQLSRSRLGDFNEEQWVNNLNTFIHEILDKLRQNNMRIQLNDNTFNSTEKSFIQNFLSFIVNRIPNIQISFCPNSYRELQPNEITKILYENHNAYSTLQFGENKTIERIKQRYYWKNMDEDIANFVKKCKTCQIQKLTRVRPTELPVISDTPTEANEKIAMDIFGPLRKTHSKNEYILSIQDMLKYLILLRAPGIGPCIACWCS